MSANITLAQSELHLRKTRLTLFGSGFVSDIWWDILIHLYLDTSGQGQDPYDLAGRIGHLPPIVIRWLELLGERGLVADVAYTGTRFTLTSQGKERVERCLASGSSR